ncbi:MAG: hypothetical protein LBI13_00780 [Streptococcaceae bacterium]|jgi:predicted RNase H-like nuclease|nr:hypothetical protein [Streptococcaceae bacterium]
MPKDMSADKRYELGMAIQYKEREIDELSQEKRNFENQLENFHGQMHQNFMRTAGLYEKMARSGNRQAENELSTDYEVERTMNQMMEQQLSEFEEGYRQKRNQLEDEIEATHRERNALPWD